MFRHDGGKRSWVVDSGDFLLKDEKNDKDDGGNDDNGDQCREDAGQRIRGAASTAL